MDQVREMASRAASEISSYIKNMQRNQTLMVIGIFAIIIILILIFVFRKNENITIDVNFRNGHEDAESTIL